MLQIPFPVWSMNTLYKNKKLNTCEGCVSLWDVYDNVTHKVPLIQTNKHKNVIKMLSTAFFVTCFNQIRDDLLYKIKKCTIKK